MDVQDFRSLQEAYMDVYQELDEGSGVVTGTAKAINTVLRPARQTPQQRDAAVGNITRGLNVVAKPIKSVLSVGSEKNKEMMQKRRPLNQDVDLFDIIKGHLMSEGYADTEESALAIMANMSEEWRESIIEGVGGYDDPVMGPNAPIGKAVRSGLNTAKNVATKVVNKTVPPNIRSAVAKKAGEITSGRYGPPGSNY